MNCELTSEEADICYQAEFDQAMSGCLPPWLLLGKVKHHSGGTTYGPPHMDDGNSGSVFAKIRARKCITEMVIEIAKRLETMQGENPPVRLSETSGQSDEVIVMGMPAPWCSMKCILRGRNAAYGWPESWKGRPLYIEDAVVIREGKYPEFALNGMWLIHPVALDWSSRKVGENWVHSLAVGEVRGVKLSEI